MDFFMKCLKRKRKCLGENEMTIMMWTWSKENSRFYTKNLDAVKQAKKDGYLVDILKEKSHIFKNV